MPWVAASLLLHRGHGPLHLDLILGTGSRCLTLHLANVARGWRVTMGVAHRRRYLTFRGPVAKRGAVGQLWHGRAWYGRSTAVLRCRMDPNQMTLMKMRRISGAVAGRATVLPRGCGEVVVPLHRAATLLRS